MMVIIIIIVIVISVIKSLKPHVIIIMEISPQSILFESKPN